MSNTTNPADYEAWYHTPRGQWIGQTEFTLLLRLLRPTTGSTLLDVGCGTGYFSRRFADAGLRVTGFDPDSAILSYARSQSNAVPYLKGIATQLPFKDESFDYCTAITSLCFVEEPANALVDMWRVSHRGVALGLLNRHSLLYRLKHGQESYRGARWDVWTQVSRWQSSLKPHPIPVIRRTAIFFPSGNILGRIAENLTPGILPWGGFLAVYLSKIS